VCPRVFSLADESRSAYGRLEGVTLRKRRQNMSDTFNGLKQQLNNKRTVETYISIDGGDPEMLVVEHSDTLCMLLGTVLSKDPEILGAPVWVEKWENGTINLMGDTGLPYEFVDAPSFYVKDGDLVAR